MELALDTSVRIQASTAHFTVMRARRGHRPVTAVMFLQSSTHFLADAQVHASICRHLPQLGFDVHAACNPGSESQHSRCLDEFSSIPSLRIRPTRFGPNLEGNSRRAIAKTAVLSGPAIISTIFGLTRYVRRHNIGVLHCSEKAREAMIGFAVALLSGARLVVHLHVKVEPWFSAPTRWVMHRADRLVAISEFVGRSAAEMGYAPSKVSVALNALTSSPDDFVRMANDRSELLEEFGAATDASILCLAARINRWKGQRELLQALEIVAPRFPNFLVLMVGRDETADESGVGMIAELRATATELGFGDRVKFTGFRSDVHRLIRASDLFTMPSHEEPFGLVYVEAMTAARPVVAIDSGGTPEVVENGVTGLLSATGDLDALADNILKLLTDPGLCERLGKAGRERALTHFSAERLATDIARIYRSL